VAREGVDLTLTTIVLVAPPPKARKAGVSSRPYGD
jgi:hypothetical protein